jgi:molybdenum cofactor guanylyltransferase
VSLVGFVVAGGRSLRMGRDKALLPWGETDLLGHALARLRALTDDVRILCGPEPRYLDRGVPVLADIVADAGPLGGVLTGLTALAPRTSLFLAVDLPLVPVPLLARLVEMADGFDAVVPFSRRGPEPLCAVYGPACLEAIGERIAAGDLRMTAFWPGVRVLNVDLADLGAPDGRDPFLNVNEPDDYCPGASG